MAKRRKKSRFTEDERKAIGARLAEARAKARQTRIEGEQKASRKAAREENKSLAETERIRTENARASLDEDPMNSAGRVIKPAPQLATLWRQAALAMLRAVRHQVFQVCTCKSKAYLNRCERYSCRHLLDAVKHLDALAVGEGLLPPMKLMQPRFDNHGTSQFRSDRPLREQHTVSIDPGLREFDEAGMPMTPAGRGQGLQDFGPSTFEVKIGP